MNRAHARWWMTLVLPAILLLPTMVHADTVATLNTVGNSTALRGVSCPSTTSCVVVGTNASTGQAALVTNGTPGAAVSVSGTTLLNGVYCTAGTNYCYAVGYVLQTIGGNSVQVPVAVGLTISGATISPGTALSVTTIGGTNQDAFNAITCPSTTICYAPTGYGYLVQLTVNNGAVTGAPHQANDVGQNLLKGIACPSATTCYVPGQSVLDTFTVSSSSVTFGSTQALAGGVSLSAISCVSSTLCYAAGGNGNTPRQGVIVPINNGTPGTAVVVPNTRLLLGISCPSAAGCHVVGEDGTSGSAQGAEAQVNVNGTTITPMTANSVPNSSFLEGIACPSASACEFAGIGTATFAGKGVVAQVTSGVTAATVSRFSVQHRAGTLAFHWHLASQHGLRGFQLFAGHHPLSRVLTVHASRTYLYEVYSAAHGPYRLTVLFANGRQETVSG